MKGNITLIIVTVVLVLMGLFLAFLSLSESDVETLEYCDFNNSRYAVGDEIIGYEDGKHCVCASGGIVECVPLDVDVESEIFDEVVVEDLDEGGLDFEYRYLTGIVEDNGDVVLNDVRFSNIATSEDGLSIVVEKRQFCPESGLAPEQEGYYRFEDNTLTLYKEIVEEMEDEYIDCFVELKYVFEDYESYDLENISIAFESNGLVEYASMCIYEGKIYSDDDVFVGVNEEIYVCDEGRIVLESDQELSD